MANLKTIILLLLVLFGLNCFSFAQPPNPEIFLFSIEKKDGKFAFADGKNITNNAGYDNQPSFSLNGSSILFTSNRNGKDTNIYEYFLADGKTTQVIISEDNEYTAKDFDGKSINFVREGKGQEMTVWKYDRQTKQESPALKMKAFSGKKQDAYS